jgi:hypothetical protein
VVFAAESAGDRVKRSGHFDHWHVGAWRSPDGTARAFDRRRYSGRRLRAGASDGPGKSPALCAFKDGIELLSAAYLPTTLSHAHTSVFSGSPWRSGSSHVHAASVTRIRRTSRAAHLRISSLVP